MDELDKSFEADDNEPTIVLETRGICGDDDVVEVAVSLERDKGSDTINIEVGVGPLMNAITHLPPSEVYRLGKFLQRVAERWMTPDRN